MTTYVAAALVAPVARRAAVEAVIAALTPSFTVSLTKAVCAISEEATWQTPATHRYTHAASVDHTIPPIWQAAASGTLPEGFVPPEGMTAQDALDAMAGIPVWSGANVADAEEWAKANLKPEGLMPVPPNLDV